MPDQNTDQTLGVTRRTFLKAGTISLVAAGLAGRSTGPAGGKDFGERKDGRKLMSSGIPLGGLGAGTVEIRDDGLFHEWQIFGNWRSESLQLDVQEAFFAFWLKTGDRKPVCNALALEPRGELAPVHGIKYTGQFPFANLEYDMGKSSCRVRLSAFSPFIPHNEQDSGIPAAVFEFEITNTSNMTCEAAIAASMRNMAGYDQPAALLKNQVAEEKGWRGIRMSAENLPADAASNGEIILATLSDESTVDAGKLGPRAMRPFAEKGAVEAHPSGLGDAGSPLTGCVSSRVTLSPHQTRKLTFLLAWHFPHFIDAEKIDIGRMYSNRFKSVSSVADYVTDNLATLKKKTRHFHDVFYRSSLPHWLLDAANAQFTTLFKSSWWTLDGTFAIWEGLGCCGTQTVDVAYYGSISLVMLFPELAKQAMRLSARFQNPSGRIPHFFPGTFQYPDAYHMIDLMPKFSLMVWRDYLWTGDREYLDQMWPHVRSAMEHNRALDRNGDFICDDHGIDQSYDGWEFEGTSSYVGLINAAAFRAAGLMARLQGEEDLGEQYERLATIGAASLDELLWNGEYFDLFYDIATDKRDKCCMSDQVNGVWFAQLLGLERLLPEEKILQALMSIFKYNREGDHVRNGVWKEGGPNHGGQWSAVWSGTEYMLASHMIYAGMQKEGLTVAKSVYDRYAKDGRTWNHGECGDHYYRAMVALGLVLAAQGFHYSLPEKHLVLDPRVERGRHVSPFITPRCWGEVSFKEAPASTTISLEVMSGDMMLSTLETGGGEKNKVKADLAGAAVSCVIKRQNGRTVICFSDPVQLAPGLVLRVRLT